jgi:hypothetical protein
MNQTHPGPARPTIALAFVSLLTCSTVLTRAAGADPPPILTCLEQTLVVGGHNVLRLQAPPGKTFRAVVWEIEGTIANQAIDRHGFRNTPLPCPLIDRPPGDATESIVSFYLDARPGNHSIGVTVEYTDGTVEMPVELSDPTPD